MNTLTRRSPVSELSLLRREMDRIFDSAFPARPDEDGHTAVWTPRADLAETEDAFLLRLDLPGINPDDVEITLEDDTLTITGERVFNKDEQNGRFHRVERSYGRFFRSFRFGTPVDADRIEASVAHGVLTLEVPKAEASKPRRIAVRQAAMPSGDGSPAEVHDVEVNPTGEDA